MNIELLKGHTTEKNALVVENYPYGYKRTSIKYWIETHKKKGDRFVSQTLNPKTNLWNNPKKSVYNAVIVMYKDLKNNHIKYFGLYPTTSKEDIQNFLKRTEGFNFSKEQENQLNILKAYSKVYENVTFKCEVKKFRNKETGEIITSVPLFEMNKYEEIGNKEGQNDKKQKEIQNKINRAVSYEYNKLKGV